MNENSVSSPILLASLSVLFFQSEINARKYVPAIQQKETRPLFRLLKESTTQLMKKENGHLAVLDVAFNWKLADDTRNGGN